MKISLMRFTAKTLKTSLNIRLLDLFFPKKKGILNTLCHFLATLEPNWIQFTQNAISNMKNVQFLHYKTSFKILILSGMRKSKTFEIALDFPFISLYFSRNKLLQKVKKESREKEEKDYL